MALFAMGLGVIVIANDFTALNVALPAIEQDFNVDVGTIQWTVNAYALVFGMGLITGGRLADMFGRRRIFFIGTAIFAGFSLLGGISQNAEQLIACRVGMGVGGALMWPAILGMTFAALPAERAGLAGGLILGVAGLGNAVGPLLGGLLTDEISWRAIFFLNVPVAVFAAAVTAAKVHQPPPDGGRQRIDYGGIVAVSLGLVALLLALDQSAEWGWSDPRVIGMFALALVSFAAFAAVERRIGEDALIPPDVLAKRRFAAACLTVLLLSAVFFSIVLYAPQLMEKVLGYSALEAGAGLLPMLASFAAVSFLAGRLYERVGGRPVIVAGTIGLAAGPLLISFFGADSSYAAMVPGLLVAGVGAGLFYPSITTAAVTAARRGALEPRRRDHLHVPDRGRRDRPRADDRDLHHSLRGQGRRRRRRGRPPPRRRSGRGDPRRPGRDRVGSGRLRQAALLRSREGSRGGQGLVRRRRPAEPAGGRCDCARRGDRRDRRGAPEARRERPAAGRLDVPGGEPGHAPLPARLEVAPTRPRRARSRARRRRSTRA